MLAPACVALVAAVAPPGTGPEVRGAICRASRAHAIPPEILLALVDVESSWRVDAVSRVGARGLTQLMPATAEEEAGKWGLHLRPGDLFDPEINVWLGASYLARLVRRFRTWPAALTAYNRGPGRTSRGDSSYYAREVLVRAADIYLRGENY